MPAIFFRFFLIAAGLPLLLQAQPKLEFNLKKPKEYEERKLGSEKSADKKFTFMRRTYQNTVTHYNYYFNANLKLDQIVVQAKQQNKDDYTKLLNFYSFTLDATSQSTELDSILAKCNAGILLHDLRNDWIDNLYLVMGKAYLLRKNYDSAAMAFQYLNFSYAPKEKDGYDIPIGSNATGSSGAYSIATKEKKGMTAYTFTGPPSRNESFIWQIRTLTEAGMYLDASSLLETLRSDPNFPVRLKEQLSQAAAYMYYKVEMWDSSANMLVKAINTADDRTEKARWWYLAGQMYNLAGKYKEASDAYAKCSDLTMDPIMDVYARLNTIRLRKSSDPAVIDQNLKELADMARKDRYSNYRDIIYYAAALIEVERDGYDNAETLLTKSLRANTGDELLRTRAFFALGSLHFAHKAYGKAGPPYDSLNVTMLDPPDSLLAEARKPGCINIYDAEKIIALQDSLLKLAAMPENERNEVVRRISRDLKKQRGIKDDPAAATNTGRQSNAQSPAPDLFATGTTFYFYDVNVRANGFQKFKETWGARPNVDNWRRSASIRQPNQAVIADPGQAANPDAQLVKTEDSEAFDTADISFDNLYSRIPLSEERRLKAQNRLISALYQKALALHQQIEDYPEAIKVYEQILSLRDTGTVVKETLFNLVHCYTKTGNSAAATEARRRLEREFGGDSVSKPADEAKIRDAEDARADAAYEKVYGLFLEGKFDEAIKTRKEYDATLGDKYWTPQLLYIQAVYHIQQRQDSLAIKTLKDLKAKFANHPLGPKADRMIEVLGRRSEIEAYLGNLQVTRAKEDEVVRTAPPPRPAGTTQQPNAAQQAAGAKQPAAAAKDTATKAPAPAITPGAPAVVSPFVFPPNQEYYVALVMEKIDPAYVNEANYSFTNSPRKNYNGQQVEASKLKLKDGLWLLLLKSAAFKSDSDALAYINYIKPVTSKEILTWLDATRYSYIIISEASLQALQQDPNLDLYKKALQQQYPGQF